VGEDRISVRKPSSPIAVAALVVAAVVAVMVGAAFFLLSGDDPEPVDGDLIAYSCKEPKNPWYAVCVMRSDGTESRRLTTRLPTTDPSWSPDGRKIAFTRNEEVGEYTTFTADDVFVMDADGSDVQRLTPDEDGMSSGQPTWSPDGREIAFVDGPSRASSVGTATALMFGDLLVMPADGGEKRLLTKGTDASPTWSPDGREIAFVRGYELNKLTGGMDLYVVHAAGGVPRRLTSTPATDETAPAWSPDGEWIAFMRAAETAPYNGKVAIFVVRRDGTGERLVHEYRYYAYTSYGLTWSPDGRLLAYEMSPSLFCTGIAVVSMDGDMHRNLASCTRPRDSALAPAWQPAAGREER
jgi:Tol biopolymer transport system component